MQPPILLRVLNASRFLDLVDLAFVLLSELPNHSLAVSYGRRRQTVNRINRIQDKETAPIIH